MSDKEYIYNYLEFNKKDRLWVFVKQRVFHKKMTQIDFQSWSKWDIYGFINNDVSSEFLNANLLPTDKIETWDYGGSAYDKIKCTTETEWK